MEKSNKPKMKGVDISEAKLTYMPPTIQVVSIAMEYSIASGSGSIGSGAVTEEWNQGSAQDKELNW
ncbi:hypothetical protein [Sphingobacterium haloxyli]|uniref:Uncharacterized protein n=1 Tax=Sphingobacterium haloxyli TaxID=2100533 RepID=A0A2S9J9C7_9SPHI|nr:hypothetical protein [Sphingobacterium haloxyli]PRD49370.1 hypothetical protein C5745_01760 [Sphingobacterium haloxyli]